MDSTRTRSVQGAGRVRRGRRDALAVAGLLILATSGCGTLRSGRGWGQDAIVPLQWNRIPAAAARAALDPGTWIPAAGAAAMSIDGFDRRVSTWATEHHPVFGDGGVALHASDRLREALLLETAVTGVLTPSGRAPGAWVAAKIRGGLVEEAGLLAVHAATDGLKDAVGRERPDGGDDRSFPSGHASMAFAGATLSNRNLKVIDMDPRARTALRSANVVAAAAVGWARVEGGRHHPADVLAGAALGNFLSAFIHDALIGIPPDSASVRIGLEASARGVRCSLRWVF